MSAPAPASIKVFVANEQALMLSGLALLLEREGFDVMGHAADAETAVCRIASLTPDVVVLGQHLAGMDGCQAAREILQASPRTKIVLLTESEDETRVIEAIEAGVSGCVSVREESAEPLFQAIRDVARGNGHWSGRLSPEAPRPGLTPRERQVLRLIAEGGGTKQIAETLNVSAKTIEAHRSNLMAKLKLRDVASLVRYAIRQGVIRP